MSKATRIHKISLLLRHGGHPELLPQMKADMQNCNERIERNYVEDHYEKYYTKEDRLMLHKKEECKNGVCEIPFAEIIEKDLCKDCCKSCNLEDCPLREMD